ncbi:MAG: ABC transporter substrate-binding protein [Pseudomonadota bacterium]
MIKVPAKIYCFAITILALALVFTSCKKKVPDGNILHVAIPASPITLDPRLATDAEGDKIAHLICDGLMKRDEHLVVVPQLAKSYEQISDTSYRFHLRDGVRFHDGTILTAEDVVYTFESIVDGSIGSPFKGTFSRIKTIEAEGPLTVRIDLEEPYAPFLTMLSRGIVSKKAAIALGDEFGTRPVCTGPYKFVRFIPDTVIELLANENYFETPPKMPNLNMEVIKDDNIRVLKLLKGDIDLVQNAIPRLLIQALLKKPALKMKEDTGIVMTYVGMNLTDPILSKEKVRKAIAYAIDRDEIISHKFRGMAVKANSILSPENWAYDPDLMQYPYDPNKAKKLLDEAGFSDPDGDGPKARFSLVFKTSTVKERVDIARMIAHQLGKVGISARVVPYEWGTFFRDIKKGNFQIYTLSWVGVTEPDIFYDVCSSRAFPPDGLNRGHYVNPKVDRLAQQGRVTMNQEKRKEIYYKVQEILIEDLPYVPLWYEKNFVIYKEGLKGVAVVPDASYRVFMEVTK